MGIYVFNPLPARLAAVLVELAFPLWPQLPPGGPASIGPAIDLKTLTPPQAPFNLGQQEPPAAACAKKLLFLPVPSLPHLCLMPLPLTLFI